MPINATFTSDYELFCDGRLTNPYPLLHQLRAEDPVHWCEPLKGWVCTRYEEVLAGHRDINTFLSARASINMGQLPERLRSKVDDLGVHLSNWLGFTDPPKHTRMRKLISKAFTPRLIANMRPRVQQIVDDLLDAAEKNGRMDYMNDYAYLLPATIICEMLGIPAEDRTRFRTCTEELASFIGNVGPALERGAPKAHESYLVLADYFHKMAEARRNDPRDDLITALATVSEDGERLNDDELLGLIVFLFVAGHETTVTLLGNGMLALLTNPKQRKLLLDDPALIDSAVEEFLRYEAPVQLNTRLAARDMVLGERRISKGQTIVFMINAANRDPAYFKNPDVIDITRQDNKHLSFGYGIHFCLGAPLARMEAQVAALTALRRFPGLKLENPDAEPDWLENMTLRCLNSMPVVF